MLEPVVEGVYDTWLLSVGHLIGPAEREAFAALGDDVSREVFIRRFWQARTPEALAAWTERFEEARSEFPSLRGDRARAWLAAGKPDRIQAVDGCLAELRALKVWVYEAWGARPDFRMVFYRDEGAGADPWSLWSPGGGPTALTYPSQHPWTVDELVEWTRANGCFRWPDQVEAFRDVLRSAIDLDGLRQRLPAPAPASDWLPAFRAELAGLDDPARALPGSPVELLFLGRYQERTVVQGRLRVPISEIERNAAGLLFDRLVITGDVWESGRLRDAFRVVHHVAGTAPADGVVTLDFFRRLRPGNYLLDLRAEDSRGLGLWRETRLLEVPRLENEAEPPAGHRHGIPGLTRADVAFLTTLPGIELRAPETPLLAGDVEIEAVTTGGPIGHVAMWLDGALAGRDDEPPWAVTLPLGEIPARHRVEAVAYDPAGRELARDALDVNAHPPRFAVRLVEPVSGKPAGRARVEVDLPEGAALDRVELYLGDVHAATRRRPPFTFFLDPAGSAPFVRAVAYLAGGESAEDLVLLDAKGGPVEEIDVRLIELYTSVVDAQGRFVAGLGAADFRVVEDGEAQPIVRFSTVENLAIHVAVLMDVSASMRSRVRMAAESAQRFFAQVMRPGDQASLLTFNHDIQRVVPFTSDVERLRHRSTGFHAWGTTRLNDSLIFTVQSFGGLGGKRALVVLSDGQDVDSDFEFAQVLEFALRAGVAVYPILLDVEDPQTVTDLRRLAQETGGNAFAISTVGQLAGVYERIEQELRSQYLLVYRSPVRAGRDFRRVEVECLRPDLRTRASRGYYP